MNSSRARAWVLFVALAMGSAAADLEPTFVRIGALTPAAGVSPEEGLREGLRTLHYIDGKNLTIERRRGDSYEALRSGARDLTELKVDVIVAFGTPAAQAALSVTSTVPVVFISSDPVGMGLATSLARPGANATGVATLSIELMPKRLELLRQVVPRVRRVILLGNPSGSLHPQVIKHAQTGAHALQMQLVTLDARNADELEAVLRTIQRTTGDAFIVSPDVLFLSNKSRIAQVIAKAKLPALFPWPDYPEPGVLMAYGASTREMGLRVAGYVDRILKGAKPADLPVEQISKYVLVVNLRAASDLGIKIPKDVLLRADEVIR